MKNLLKEWTLFEKVWLVSFTAVILYLSIAWGESPIAAICSLTGMLSVVLVAKGKISNYYFGIVNVAIYAWLSFEQGFYGDTALYALYFVPMQFIGWYMWKRSNATIKGENFGVKVAVMTTKMKLFWTIVSIVGIAILAVILTKLNGTLAIIDSSTTVLQIVAMILMVKRFKEQWSIWILVNVLGIVMWLYAALNGTADFTLMVMWIAYLVNSIYGYVMWKKAEKKEKGEN